MPGQKSYTNPWPSYSKPGILKVLNSLIVPKSSMPDTDLPPPPIAHQPDMSDPIPTNEKCIERSGARVMWLGLASVYLQIPHDDGVFGVLFDPIFSQRCSPVKFLGPKRRIPTPCSVSQLPHVHLVVISHDHYDHLDKSTLLDIERHHQGARYLVPSGVGSTLVSYGIRKGKITELGWWESTHVQPLSSQQLNNTPSRSPTSDEKEWSPTIEVEIPSGTFTAPPTATAINTLKDDSPSSPISITFSETTTLNDEPISKPEGMSIVATCCPAQHNSGRKLFGCNASLWGSWYMTIRVRGETLRVYFAGDTGYRSKSGGPTCPIFRDIASTLGPPDLSLIPIAAGACLPYIEQLTKLRLNITSLTRHLHCPPEDAFEIHRDLQSEMSLGIHWGTFTTNLGASRTRAEFQRVKVDGFDLRDVGEWMDLGPDWRDVDYEYVKQPKICWRSVAGYSV